MKESYPELETDFKRILAIAIAEEESFLRTLVAGSIVLDEAIASTKSEGSKELAGDTAFLLHDTYGFPIDLTLEVAEEQGLSVNRDAFKTLMNEQRDRAKADAREKKLGGNDLSVYSEFRALGITKFTGYDSLETQAKVLGLIRDGAATKFISMGEIAEVILDETSLYAESGGQEADSGIITGDGFQLEVLDVQKPVKGLVTHKVLVRSGEVSVGSSATTSVDYEWRLGACQAHSATHVLHAALREVLGPSALQSGSYNKPGYLRLDYAWQQALSTETKSEIEEVSNLAIRGDLGVSAQFMSVAEAKASGAVALFGETYDESVRVVQIGGPWSRELCGGTHVARSSQIGLVALTSESSVGSGSRRIEALVGIEAFRSFALERSLVSRLTDAMKAPKDQLEERILATLEELKQAQRKLSSLQAANLQQLVPEAVAKAATHSGHKFVQLSAGDVSDANELRTLAQSVVRALGTESGLAVITSASAGKPVVAIATTEAARSQQVKAGELVRIASSVLGGGGGGKDDFAQGGGSDASKIEEAILAVIKALG